MLQVIIGIAIGAAFAPFWMMIWGMAKPFVMKVVGPIVNFFKPKA